MRFKPSDDLSTVPPEHRDRPRPDLCNDSLRRSLTLSRGEASRARRGPFDLGLHPPGPSAVVLPASRLAAIASCLTQLRKDRHMQAGALGRGLRSSGSSAACLGRTRKPVPTLRSRRRRPACPRRRRGEAEIVSESEIARLCATWQSSGSGGGGRVTMAFDAARRATRGRLSSQTFRACRWPS
jgi:hypothetical protein